MKRNNEKYFFDVVEFESIIDYYIESNNSPKAFEAATLAIQQHPNSVSIQVRKARVLLDKGRAVEALREFEIVGDVRGEGFMMAVEFVADRATKKSFDPALTVGRRVHQAAYERGLTVRYSADSVFISPPLVLDEGQATWLADTLRDAIAAVAAELTV